MSLDARSVRRAVLRALVASLPASYFLVFWRERVGLLVALAFAAATLPLSLAEIALVRRGRPGAGAVLLGALGALVLTVAAMAEAVYAEGLVENRTADGGLRTIQEITDELVDANAHEYVPFLRAMLVCVGTGAAASLWAPFVAATFWPRATKGGFMARTLLVLACGLGAVSPLAAGAIHVLGGSLSAAECLTFLALGALPGAVVLPLAYLAADALERWLWRPSDAAELHHDSPTD